MSIGNIVNYETTFTLELEHPVTGEEIGVSFEVRSASSDESKATQRRQLDFISKQKQRNKEVNISTFEQFEKEKAAACIADWDWKGQELHKGEGVLECTKENIMKAMNIDWIFDQVTRAAKDIANFTKG